MNFSYALVKYYTRCQQLLRKSAEVTMAKVHAKKLSSYLVMRNCTMKSICQCCTVTVIAVDKNPLPNPSFTPYFTLHSSTEGNGRISCFPEQLVDDEVVLGSSFTTSPPCCRFHLRYKSLSERERRRFLPPLVHLAR